MRPNGIVTLLTDFGDRDMYVGAMKGALLSVYPGARIVDITHYVPPQNVRAGAFTGAGAWRYFPEGTIHLGVVDPGVGTDRRALLLETPTGWFLGPDNGLLSPVLPPGSRPADSPRP